MNPILANLESFSLEQDVNPSVAVLDPTLRELSNPLSKNDWILSGRLPSATRSNQGQHATSASLTDLEAVLHEGDERPLLSNLQSFFLDDLLQHIDAHPLVSLVNRYHRQYFLSGDGLIRVTIDTDLQAFDQRFGRVPHFDRPIAMPDMLVVEFKFSPQDRANAMDLMKGIPLRVSRSSKYSIGCSNLIGT